MFPKIFMHKTFKCAFLKGSKKLRRKGRYEIFDILLEKLNIDTFRKNFFLGLIKGSWN